MEKSQVANAVADAIDVTPVAIVKHNNARVTIARPMSTDETDAFERGEQLALCTVDVALTWETELRACKTVAKRAALKAGFASQWSAIRGVTLESAQRKFDRMALEFTPETSRKHKANAKAKAKRKGKTGARQINATDKAPAWITAALAYISKRQRYVDMDSDHGDDLAAIAAILHGEAPGAKRKGRKTK